MATIVTHRWSFGVRSSDGFEGGHGPIEVRWAPGAGTSPKRETVTVTASAFTALSPPTGTKAVAILLGTATGLTLKGITGDTGTTLTPTSNPLGVDAFFPLGASPLIGLASSNTANQTVEVIWF